MKYASAWWESLCGESQDLGEAGIQRYALSVSNLDSYSLLVNDYTGKNSKSHTESMSCTPTSSSLLAVLLFLDTDN
jgi:hypothetical protein